MKEKVLFIITSFLILSTNCYATISEMITQEYIGDERNVAYAAIGKTNNVQLGYAQRFRVSEDMPISSVELRAGSKFGTPTGNLTIRIETDSSNKPSGILADVDLSLSAVPPADGTITKYYFNRPSVISGNVFYWIVVKCDDQSNNNFWRIVKMFNAHYIYGRGALLSGMQWYNEDSYALYFKLYRKNYYDPVVCPTCPICPDPVECPESPVMTDEQKQEIFLGGLGLVVAAFIVGLGIGMVVRVMKMALRK